MNVVIGLMAVVVLQMSFNLWRIGWSRNTCTECSFGCPSEHRHERAGSRRVLIVALMGLAAAVLGASL